MNTPESNNPPLSNQPQTQPSKASFISKLKNLSKKQKILIGGGLILVLTTIVLIGIFNKPKGGIELGDNKPQAGYIAQVGDTQIPQSYLDLELSYYPATPTAEAKKMLTAKLVDDQITLEKAKEEGFIDNYPTSQTMTREEYLQRTAKVSEAIDKISAKGNIIRGKKVMVWFYNNGYVGQKGFAANKKLAYDKIKPLYDQVKSGQITIDQAGLKLKGDRELASIDPVWESNALSPFLYYENAPGTHWPEFNKLLWETEPGGITPLYIGATGIYKGNPAEELYIFAQVDEKSVGSSYDQYKDWLDQKRQEYDVAYSELQSFFLKLMPKSVFAQDDSGSNSNDNGSNQSSNDNNSDNGNNNNNGSKSGRFIGTIRSQTGAPVNGAVISVSNPVYTKTVTSDSSGKYDTGVDYNLSCFNNPHTTTVTYNGITCGQKTITLDNGDILVPEDYTCGPPPPTPAPTAPPACSTACQKDGDCVGAKDGCTSCVNGACAVLPACNVACQKDGDCAGARDGCTSCIEGSCKAPPACNTACERDGQCVGAKDGCVECRGGTCKKPPACNDTCTTPADCEGAKDGCTACIEGSCKKPPACGDSCTSKAQCAGAKDGCTECLEGTCTDYNQNMCKCDGIDSVIKYPSDKFDFTAYAKVEGADIAKAQVQSIQIFMAKDNNIIARSAVMTPQVAETTAGKIRVKASWSTKPPTNIDPKSTYRVWADIKCKPKKRLPNPSPATLGTNAVDVSDKGKGVFSKVMDYFSELFGVKTSVFKKQSLLNSGTVLAATSADDSLQLQTLEGVRIVETDSCRFVNFKFEEGLFD